MLTHGGVQKKTQNLIKKFNFNFNLPDNSINNLARILKN